MKRHISRLFLSVILASWLDAGLATTISEPEGDGQPSSIELDFNTDQPPGTTHPLPPEVIDQFSQYRVLTLSEAKLLERSAGLREKIAENPENPVLLHELGTVTFRLGGRKEALFLWHAAATKDPNLAPADLMESLQEVFARLEYGDPQAAQELLQAAGKRFSSQPHFHLARAEQAMRSGNPAAAEVSFQRAYELAPELYVTSLNLARFYAAVGKTEAAASLFQEAARLVPARAEVWTHYGTFLHGQKDFKGALQALRKARSLDSSLALPEQKLAELSLAGEDYAAARDWYRRALETRPAPGDVRNIRAALGDVLLRLGLLEEARTEIEAVLAEREVPPLLFALATIDEAQGDLGNAESRYRRVLQLMPGNPLSANNLAMLLIRGGNSYTEALSLAQDARRALPDNAIVESTFGCALAHNADDAQAVEVLNRVVEAMPEDAWAHYCLGMSLLSLGQAEDARAHLARVEQLDPLFPLQTRVDALLNK